MYLLLPLLSRISFMYLYIYILSSSLSIYPKQNMYIYLVPYSYSYSYSHFYSYIYSYFNSHVQSNQPINQSTRHKSPLPLLYIQKLPSSLPAHLPIHPSIPQTQLLKPANSQTPKTSNPKIKKRLSIFFPKKRAPRTGLIMSYSVLFWSGMVRSGRVWCGEVREDK